MIENAHNKHHDFATKFLECVNNLKEESDRGCIIVAAAWIDDDLKTAINKFLIPKAERTDELLHESKALGNFAARIDIAYRLGLIQNETRNMLHILRKMRNDCAHKRAINSFTESSTKNRTVELAKGVEIVLEAMWKVMLENFPQYLKHKNYKENAIASTNIRKIFGTRRLFTWAVSSIITGFAFVQEEIVPLHE